MQNLFHSHFYNVGQDVGDVISLFIGGAEVIRGSGEVAAGLLGSPETGGVSLAVSTKGVVDVTHGSLIKRLITSPTS